MISGIEERVASGIEDQLLRKAGRKPGQVPFSALGFKSTVNFRQYQAHFYRENQDPQEG